MNRKLLNLIGMSLALLPFVGNAASVHAQVYGGYSDGYGTYAACPYPIYGMNPPTECDDCDYRCAGYGHRGWYQRNFGSNYSFAGWCGNAHLVCGHCGVREACFWGCRHGQRCQCPALCASQTPACCSPVANCSFAKVSGGVVKQPGNVAVTHGTVALSPVSISTSLPALDSSLPLPLTELAKPGV